MHMTCGFALSLPCVYVSFIIRWSGSSKLIWAQDNKRKRQLIAQKSKGPVELELVRRARWRVERLLARGRRWRSGRLGRTGLMYEISNQTNIWKFEFSWNLQIGFEFSLYCRSVNFHLWLLEQFKTLGLIWRRSDWSRGVEGHLRKLERKE